MKRHLWIFLFWAPLIAIVLTGSRIYYSIEIWKYDGQDTEFIIQPGEGFSKINHNLSEQKIISNSRIFYRYAQLNDLMTKFRAGRYLIKKDSNMIDVLETLLHGQPLTKEVTIPEGKNIFEIGKILEKEGITSYEDFVASTQEKDFVLSLNIPANSVEGYLYPETYRFTINTQAKQVIKAMIHEFKKKTLNLNFDSAPFSKHDVVILASIVEKETGEGSERPMIAGVFFNRLKKRMRLQSDPTTIYGKGENFSGNLKREDLLEATPYNTYKVDGLPAGPISNPGRSAIEAVLNPAKHEYLYFVSHNDGTHEFTKSYKDHLQAVETYQKNYQNRQGKSWRDLKSKEKPAKSSSL